MAQPRRGAEIYGRTAPIGAVPTSRTRISLSKSVAGAVSFFDVPTLKPSTLPPSGGCPVKSVIFLPLMTIVAALPLTVRPTSFVVFFPLRIEASSAGATGLRNLQGRRVICCAVP